MAHPIENLSDLKQFKNLINKAINKLGYGKAGIAAVNNTQSYRDFCELTENEDKKVRLREREYYVLKKYLLKINYKRTQARYNNPNDEEWIHQYKIPMEEEYHEVQQNEVNITIPTFDEFEDELAFESDKLLAEELDEETEELIKSTNEKLDSEYFYERKEVDVTPNFDDLSENTIDKLKGEVEDDDM